MLRTVCKSWLLAFVACFIALSGQGQVVWEHPSVEENSHIEGYFKTLLQVTKVELTEEETRVSMCVAFRPKFWVRFDKDTYLLADGKRYAVKSCDGLELGKETYLPDSGKMDVTFHFEPLPLKTTRFDFMEGDNEGDFRLIGIEDVSTRIKRLFPSVWRNVETGDCDIAFYEECVVYDSRFWNYKEQKQKGDKYRFVLEHQGREVAVQVGKSKKKCREITIDGKTGKYELLTSITLPDYLQQDGRTAFKDTGYQAGDSVTLIGWIRGMSPKLKELGDIYNVTIENILNDEGEPYTCTLDSLGRFEMKIPMLNASEAYADWKRTYIRTLLEPGETYLLLYDMKKGHKLFMGKDVRLQNELMSHPVEWSGFRLDFGLRGQYIPDEVMEKYLPEHQERMQRLARLIEAHPNLSERYRQYVRGHYLCGFGESLMQARFYMKDGVLPATYMEYVKNLWNELPRPYTFCRESSTLLRDFIAQTIYDKYAVRLEGGGKLILDNLWYPTLFKRWYEAGKLEITDEELYVLEQKNAAYTDYLNKTVKAADDAEREKIGDEYTNSEIKIRADSILQREEIRKIIAMERPLMDVYRMQGVLESLDDDPLLKEILTVRYLYNQLDDSRKPLSDYVMNYVEENVQLPAAKDFIKRENDKYVALENKELRYATSLRGNDVVDGLEEGEAILRKILEPMKGKVVLIDVWGTWCGPCKAALSHSQEQYERLAKYDIAYLYLANRSDEKSWKNVIKEYNVSGENVYHYNLPAKQQSKIEAFLKVNAFPTYKIVDKEGNILDIDVEARNLNGLETVVRKLCE